MFLMIARLFIGVGLFALGYLVGREMGRAESVRDQLSGASEGDASMPGKQAPEGDIESETSKQTAVPRNET
jgi:hypothetical protein